MSREGGNVTRNGITGNDFTESASRGLRGPPSMVRNSSPPPLPQPPLSPPLLRLSLLIIFSFTCHFSLLSSPSSSFYQRYIFLFFAFLKFFINFFLIIYNYILYIYFKEYVFNDFYNERGTIIRNRWIEGNSRRG